MKIAVDFDGTIAKWANYPEIGELVPYADKVINRLVASGHEIIIWTCRGEGGIEPAVDWLAEKGITHHAVNQNCFVPRFVASPKVIADLYIDDKALGCPLVPNQFGRPYVDWLAVELMLQRMGAYTIPFQKGELLDE